MSILPRPDRLVLGDAAVPVPPHLAAVVEARGALLVWRIDRDEALPDALIHDSAAALQWLPEIYGAGIADALASGDTHAARPAAPGAAAERTRLLAHLAWCTAWWPAGLAVPRLPAELLAAETAVLTAELEYLLDAPDAPDRALDAARGALVATGAADGALAAALRNLLEDYGIEPDESAAAGAAQADWALAAGGAGAGGGLTAATGTAEVAWAGVPAQTVAADGLATWSLVQRDGATVLRVAVPATGPGARPVARFGPDGLVVPLSFDGLAYTGETAATPGLLRLRTADRTLRVHDPRMTAEAPDPEPAAERAAVLAFAGARLAHPWTSAERSAAGGRP